MSFQSIIFDLDGTLTDSVADITTALNMIRQKEGFPLLSLTEVLNAVGDGARKLVERTMPQGSDINNILAEFMVTYREHLSEKTLPYDGIPQLLEQLNHRDIRLAVVSNKPHLLTYELLKQLSLSHHFAYIQGYAGGAKKPSPEPILHAIKSMDSTPDKTLMIGDHHTDLLAGNSAGCKTCFCSYGYGSIGDANYDFCVQSVSELTTFLLKETK